MSDQHRASVAGFAGDLVVRTPTLDRLAAGGVVFTNAYAPSPICVPGRQCMMSGQLPRTCRCEVYGKDLPPFSMTFAKRLAQYAYRTVCVGKLHHMGADQMQGWTSRLAPDAELADNFVDGLIKEEVAPYAAPAGTGKWTNIKEILRAGIADGRYQQFDRAVLESTRMFIRRHFLDPEYDRPGSHRPLLLKVSLLQSHYPFFTDAERFEYYLNRVPIHNGEPRFDHPRLSRTQCGPDVDVNDRDARRATAAYYGMVETVDQHFAEILDQLMQGETRNWHERFHNETISQCHGTDLMVKRGSLKYLAFQRDNHPEVLFDLAADPRELRNAIADGQYAEAVAAFRRRRDELGFGPASDPQYVNAGYG